MGGSSTKIVTFGSENFVRYSRHVRYLGCKFTNSVNLLAQSHWLIKKLSTLPKLGIKFGNVSLSAHFQNVNVTETWYNYFHDNKSLFHFGAFLGPLECTILGPFWSVPFCNAPTWGKMIGPTLELFFALITANKFLFLENSHLSLFLFLDFPCCVKFQKN